MADDELAIETIYYTLETIRAMIIIIMTFKMCGPYLTEQPQHLDPKLAIGSATWMRCRLHAANQDLGKQWDLEA